MNRIIFNILAIMFVFLVVLVANAEPTISIYDSEIDKSKVIIQVCEIDMCRSLTIDKDKMADILVDKWVESVYNELKRD